MAYELGERQMAIQGLDQLLALGRLKNYQAERAVRLRIDEDQFSDAAAMAARLYPRFPEDGMVSAWLDALAVLKTASGMREMVSALQPAHRRALEGTASFLERRAGLYLAVGEAALAKLSADERTLVEASIAGDRKTLIVDSAIPATMAAIYLILLIYFKAIGGYKPVKIDSGTALGTAEN